MANITLRNVKSIGNLLPPGIIRTNETNPGTGFVFDNVSSDGWWFGKYNYITENIYGEVIDSSPEPYFMDPSVPYDQ